MALRETSSAFLASLANLLILDLLISRFAVESRYQFLFSGSFFATPCLTDGPAVVSLLLVFHVLHNVLLHELSALGWTWLMEWIG